MKKVKKFLSVLCAACMAITLLPSAMAADLPSEPNVYRLISAQEFNSIAPRSTATGRVMLPRSNSSGTNGVACSEFVADESNAMESAISPIVITATEFDAISAQTEHVGRIMLPHTNPEGSNGNSCGEFVANEANVAFSILSAPATESYNVQLYHGTASSGGIPVYLYAKDVPIGSGVWFSNLIVGDTYFFKVSSSTAPVPGSNARYSYKTFSFPTITVSTDVAVDIKN